MTKRVPNGAHYVEPEYDGRMHRIYRRDGASVVLRRNARYRTLRDQRKRDLGALPRYGGATVLLRSDFRYWGGDRTIEYRNRFPRTVALLKRLTQGHRVNISADERVELVKLQRREWRRHPRTKVLGAPSDPDYARVCDQSEGTVSQLIRDH